MAEGVAGWRRVAVTRQRGATLSCFLTEWLESVQVLLIEQLWELQRVGIACNRGTALGMKVPNDRPRGEALATASFAQ